MAGKKEESKTSKINSGKEEKTEEPKAKKKTSSKKRGDEIENNLSMYLQDARNEELLTRDEEIELVKKVQAGDMKARTKLIKSNLRFVISIAKKYQNSGIPLEDLISEGNVGLIIAADRFDPSKGYHFISYAVWWIKQAIMKSISEKSRLIRLPLNRANELIEIERKEKELFRKLGREPNVDELAEELNINKTDIANLLNVTRDYVSLEEQFSHIDVEGNLLDILEDKKQRPPDQDLIDEDLKTALRGALDQLTETEAEVIKLRYGLDGDKPQTLKEIGDVYDLTKERIRQIEKKALRKMKLPNETGALKDFFERQ